MDCVFQAEEATAYENWLETKAGAQYLRATSALLDRVLDCRPGWRVLDVGCGLGIHLAHLMERGMLVHGLEAGPVPARLAARRLGSKADVDVGDAHDLPYEDNSFDAVVLLNTLELVDRRAQVLAEAARVAASRVCLVAANGLSPTAWCWRLPGSRHPLRHGSPLGLWSLRRLVREVLGPVPQTWAGAVCWPRVNVGLKPWGGLVGVCAAVTPRFMTRPLVAEPRRGAAPPHPAHSHGRVIVLQRVK
jgi:SAM-dependent methyltransferase